jgi:type IV secretory pathway VirD2 relaxase
VRVVCNSDLDPQDINAAKLERLGLADQVGPAQGTLKTGLEPTLRDLAIRGDIIKTMRRAMSGAGNEPDVARFALHGDQPAEAVLGRLVERGLHDELKGMAYPSSTASTGARTTLFSLAWK